MEAKKNPAFDVHRFSKLFFGIGLSTSVALTITAFQWSTPVSSRTVERPGDWAESIVYEPPVVQERPQSQPKSLVKKTTLNTNPIVAEVVQGHQGESAELPDPVDEIWFDSTLTITLPLEESTEPVVTAEVMPEPVGGYSNFYQQIGQRIRYTRQALRANISGKVFVQFVVGKDGTLRDVQVVRGLGFGLDEEAAKAVQLSDWRAGRQRGKAVNVRMILPIHFKIP